MFFGVAMKTREADCRFPVLGFTPDREIWGFPDLDTLTSCGPRTLRDNSQSGMELVDIEGRCWVVRSVRRTGRGEPLLAWLISHLLSTPQSRIEHELDAMPALTLDDVKARVCVSLEAFPQDYCHADERDTVFAELLESVRAAKDIATIHELLGLDSFMSY
jgi:hypothetical protein